MNEVQETQESARNGTPFSVPPYELSFGESLLHFSFLAGEKSEKITLSCRWLLAPETLI